MNGRLELPIGAFPWGFGFLMEWQLRIVGFLIWQLETPRSSSSNQGERYMVSPHHILLVKAATILPMDSRGGNLDPTL